MRRGLSAEDKVVLERLQSELAQRADGAVDFWTAVCLGPLPNAHDFLAHNSSVLMSLAVVLRALLARTGAADEEARGLVECIEHACSRICRAFIVLEQFRTAQAAEVHSAVDDLVGGHGELLAALAQLGEVTDCPARYLDRRAGQTEAHIRPILGRLHENFVEARTAEPVLAK